MQFKVLIIGSNGSMGKRYQAILSYLKENNFVNVLHGTFDMVDKKDFPNIFDYSHIILCTPTDTHEVYLTNVLKYFKGAILCEKPVIKSASKVIDLLNGTQDISMMFQYAYLLSDRPTDDLKVHNFQFGVHRSLYTISSYDYFRTGGDGLLWDCMQIIGLHNGPPSQLFINNHSPIWNCTINGVKKSIADMDNAYVNAVRDWLLGRRFSKDFIKLVHTKTEYIIKKVNGEHTPKIKL